jgi:hypothetical protein
MYTACHVAVQDMEHLDYKCHWNKISVQIFQGPISYTNMHRVANSITLKMHMKGQFKCLCQGSVLLKMGLNPCPRAPRLP